MRFEEYLTEQDQFFNTKEEINEWISEQEHDGFTINDDLTVDIHENYSLISKIKLFPIQFGEVNGIFSCYNNNLTSLEGAPREVGEDFYCSNNNLISLKGAPKEVGGSFNCSFNNLTSLEGAPKEVSQDFYCSNNNNNLTSLEGAPREVGENFNAINNKFTEEPDHSFIEIGGTFTWK